MGECQEVLLSIKCFACDTSNAVSSCRHFDASGELCILGDVILGDGAPFEEGAAVGGEGGAVLYESDDGEGGKSASAKSTCMSRLSKSRSASSVRIMER